MDFKDKIVNVFSKLDPKAMFITIYGYENDYSEVANFSLCWHINYIGSVNKALAIMKMYKPSGKDVKPGYTLADLEKARYDWMESLSDTLEFGPEKNSRYTNKNTYIRVVDVNNKVIPGVKLHIKQDTLHMSEVVLIKKTIIRPGHYPHQNRSSITLAKQTLRNMTPLGKWRQFKLEAGRFDKIVVQKTTLFGN